MHLRNSLADDTHSECSTLSDSQTLATVASRLICSNMPTRTAMHSRHTLRITCGTLLRYSLLESFTPALAILCNFALSSVSETPLSRIALQLYFLSTQTPPGHQAAADRMPLIAIDMARSALDKSQNLRTFQMRSMVIEVLKSSLKKMNQMAFRFGGRAAAHQF